MRQRYTVYICVKGAEFPLWHSFKATIMRKISSLHTNSRNFIMTNTSTVLNEKITITAMARMYVYFPKPSN